MFNIENINHTRLSEIITFMKVSPVAMCFECNSLMTMDKIFQRIDFVRFIQSASDDHIESDVLSTSEWRKITDKKYALLTSSRKNKITKKVIKQLIHTNNNLDNGTKCMFILLQCVIPKNAQQITSDGFRLTPVDNNNYEKYWNVKLCLIYCVLMIIISIWRQKDFNLIEQSYFRSRIYIGVCDFYCSYFLYILYGTQIEPSHTMIDFELFHNCYTSNFVFFFEKYFKYQCKIKNLFALIYNISMCVDIYMNETKAGFDNIQLTQALSYLETKYPSRHWGQYAESLEFEKFIANYVNIEPLRNQTNFILRGFKILHESFFLGLFRNILSIAPSYTPDRDYTAFFENIDGCYGSYMNMIATTKQIKPLTIKTFHDIFGQTHWRNFIGIQMPLIEVIMSRHFEMYKDYHPCFTEEWSEWWKRFQQQVNKTTNYTRTTQLACLYDLNHHFQSAMSLSRRRCIVSEL